MALRLGIGLACASVSPPGHRRCARRRQNGSGESFQAATRWCGGQAAGAVTGVDADDEHREYGGYRAGQERGDDGQGDGGGH